MHPAVLLVSIVFAMIPLVGAWMVIAAVKHAPEGFENEDGFQAIATNTPGLSPLRAASRA